MRLEHVCCVVEEVCVWSSRVGKRACLWSSGKINGHGHACQRDEFLGLQEEEKSLLRYSQRGSEWKHVLALIIMAHNLTE